MISIKDSVRAKVMHTCIDLFAGTGGLSEGFSRAGFKVAISIEKESIECETLRQRKLHNELLHSKQEDLAMRLASEEASFSSFEESHPKIASRVKEQVAQIELGTAAFSTVYDTISNALKKRKDGALILLGGPPCQAYSIVGRARKVGQTMLDKDPTALSEFYKDQKHTLYREYLKVLSVFTPEIFIMENVKGILSAKTSPDAPAGSVIEKIFSDLQSPFKALASDQDFMKETEELGISFRRDNYVLFPFPASETSDLFDKDGASISKKDFTIKSEKYNIPQTRHRVIICGVRRDIFESLGRPGVLSEASSIVSVQDMIGSLPKLRSKITKEKVPDNEWALRVKKEVAKLTSITDIDIVDGCNTVEYPCEGQVESNIEFTEFIEDSLGVITNHKTRSHMVSDLARYYFCADFAERERKSPKIEDWPVSDLIPNHADINRSGNRPHASGFSDRFKVQIWDRPSSTITSHISKDGHYFIHPDKTQCRSLSVREAARLQTFPDSYQFCGGISKQFHQIGNAVPPYLAYQIAKLIKKYLKGI